MGVLNDLWKFNTTTHEWTWIGGNSVVDQNPNDCFGFPDGEICAYPGVYGTKEIPGITNTPGSRMNATAWTDSQGNLWLFGGFGIDSGQGAGQLNDLWRYKP
jgi:N-acetylneuraminic acid mutarotase